MSTPAVASVVDLSGWSRDDLAALLQRLVTGPPGHTVADMFKRVVQARAATPAVLILLEKGVDQPVLSADEETYAVLDAYIDYFRGRAIKTRLFAGVVNTRLYDKTTAAGSFSFLAAQVAKERSIHDSRVVVHLE